MKKKHQTPLYGFSDSRRRFLSTMLRSGFSLGAAIYAGNMAFARDLDARPLGSMYDYIIVGAGSAGCVLASRLSESGFHTLLIEAGTDDISQTKIADSAEWLSNLGSDTDWSIPITPQSMLDRREFSAPAGKVLGGSGSINAMFWLRPDVRDLYRLRSLFGQHQSPQSFYRAFRRVERFLSSDSQHRSTEGRITVARYADKNPLSQASIHAANEIGIETKDHNASPLIDGCGFADVNIEPTGTRSGPAQTYLADAVRRPQFDVVPKALVTQLLIAGDLCQGIECLVNNERHSFYASKDVIVCAGSFGSPKLLMLSGIGDENQLARIGIRAKHHLPAVGRNLQDHLIVAGLSYTGGPRYSPISTLGRVATHTFFSTAKAHEPPNIQVTCMQQPFPPGTVPNDHGFSLLPWLAKVESRGSIALVNGDPRTPVIANPGYLISAADREILAASVELTVAMGETRALQDYIEAPLFSRSALASKSGRMAFIRENAMPGIHFVGTCSAGMEPRNSVVDRYFRVWGMRNLRVVDGSVFPEVPGVNPQAAILTVAEIAADMAVHVTARRATAS